MSEILQSEQQLKELKSAIAKNQKVEIDVIEKFLNTKGFFDKKKLEARTGKIEK